MLTGLAVLILLVTIAVLVLTVLPKFKIVQKLIDNINALTRENLTGIRVVRAFNAEKYQEDKFEVGNHKLTSTQLFNQKNDEYHVTDYVLNHELTDPWNLLLRCKLISDAGMASKLNLFSDMVVFSSYAMQVIMSFLMLAMIFHHVSTC